jgi:glycogen debranching enzyme GlgX/4-alpha-glucanotransferase
MILGWPSNGDPEPLGVTPRGDGVNVAVFSANATAIEFCLFEGEREVRRVRLRGRTGDVFHDHVAGVAPGARYGLRAHGPFLPLEGHRFNAAKLLIDPYARAIDRPLVLHKSMFAWRTDVQSLDETDSASFVPKAIVMHATSSVPASPLTSWSRTVLYELHVRGFTASQPDVPEASRGRFAGLAHPAAIDHLVQLGVTTVEIMPAAAWIEERHLASLGLRNYWGYNPIAFMAPDPGLAPDGWDEIRAAVVALEAAGIEVILDVVLNHSGEGDALGPTLSLRGLDNATYYRSLPGTPWRYADDTGCGNTLALDRLAPLRLAMDTLRFWATQTGVHGFRFDLATTMGRRDDGFDPAAPLLSAIAQDPLLRDLKLIAEPWDVGPGGYRVGAFPAAWGEWNDRFRDGVRRFWRGDRGQLGELATRFAGSSDLFASRAVASRSVNFVVAHDGFTLADLVSYTHKVNAANGEANRDGTDANFSWNNGVEGPSDDPAVAAARGRDQRALLATLILSRGTPMLAMGSEFGHSQGGNNNVYAQDNVTAWLDWGKADKGLIAWTRNLLRIRHDHAVLRGDRFLTGAPCDVSLFPDVDWRDASGQAMTPEAWRDPDGNTLVVTLAGAAETKDATDRVSVILHRGQANARVTLTPPRAGYAWCVVADSGANTSDGPENMQDPVRHPETRVRTGSGSTEPSSDAESGSIVIEPAIAVAARSVIVLVERPRGPRRQIAADPALLDRLARAAGIAPEWWDADRRRTVVSDDTRRALLAAMRLPATTEGEARDTLRHLSDDRDRRGLPRSLVTRSGEPAVLSLGLEPGLSARPVWLTVELESGETTRFQTSDGRIEEFTGCDGLAARAWRVSLPALPDGRHRIRREDALDTVCHLTVAPRRCFLPASIHRGARHFGISAQLYALRRANDPGIGDFTTLALLAEAAGREGAATIGLNPLHMLFPGERERASPYHPSDRRFLDPIYLDVAGADGSQIPALDRGDLVAWTEVWAWKKAVLERQFRDFTTREQADPLAATDFHRFLRDGGPDLWRFAAFQAITEQRPGEIWRQWPEGLRSPAGADVAAFANAHADRVRFHQYLQFLADRQFASAAARASDSGLESGLFRDLAVGAAPDGAEVWAGSEDIAEGAWIGAPPDPFAAEGQNWHLPPPLPLRMARNGFASFATLIAANMRHAGALRIDHAMGLTRLFWIPDGGIGADGAYVAYPFAGLLGQVALESVRACCMVIGEDLGNVPDGFRPVLTEADILSYRVLLLEREGRDFRPSTTYPARAVACVTTHDLPPLAGWWEGADIRERAVLGLLPPGEDAEAERNAERVALTETLVAEGCLVRPESGDPPIEAVMNGAYEFVAGTQCDLVLVQAEDLAGMRVGVNLPGTDTERPNWRRRLPEPVETLLTSDAAQTILGALRGKNRGVTAPD